MIEIIKHGSCEFAFGSTHYWVIDETKLIEFMRIIFDVFYLKRNIVASMWIICGLISTRSLLSRKEQSGFKGTHWEKRGWKDRVHPQFCMLGTMHHVDGAVCVWSLRKFYIKFMLWRIQIVIYVEICDLNHLSENFPLENLYIGVWSNSMLCIIPNNQNSIKIIYVLNIS